MTQAPEPHGVVFPSTGAGRSTSALGRAVVADALRAADPIGARAAENETAWRRDYRLHFRRLVEAALPSTGAAVAIARAGLASVHERMRFSTVDTEVGLDEAPRLPVEEPLHTTTIDGTARPVVELVLPYKGMRLRGAELTARLDTWVDHGVVE